MHDGRVNVAASEYGYGSPRWEEQAAKGESFGFRAALLLSLALHGLALGVGHALQLPDPVPRVLFALLRSQPAPKAQPAPATLAIGPPPERPPLLARQGRGGVLTDAVSAPGRTGQSAGPFPAPLLPSPESGAQEGALDGDGVRRYRLALGSAMRHHRHYPNEARRNGWQGRVDLRLTMFGDGRPCLVALEKSSGYALLDQQAGDMLLASARETTVPESLRGRDFILSLSLIFDLQD